MRIVPVSIATAMAVNISGCAVTSVEGERMTVGSEPFAAYVEAVFRRQNDIATELAFAIDDTPLDSERYELLDAAELELQQACSGLNQLARAQRAGEAVRGFGALKRARAAPDCELATDHAAALILGSDP